MTPILQTKFLLCCWSLISQMLSSSALLNDWFKKKIIFGTFHHKAIWFWSNIQYLKLTESINSLKCMHENVHKHYEWKPKNRNNSNDHQVIHWKNRCWSVAAEALLLWPPNGKSWHTGKDSDAGKEWRKEEKGTTGWDGWMASRTQWTWVWINSRS